MKRRDFLSSAASMAACWHASAALASTDAYPSKPIRLVVPFAAGGGNDVVARLLGDALAPILHQPLVVENRVGAGGNLGTDFVAKSPADGYTLVHVSNSVVMNPYLYKKIPFDITRDLTPVALVATTPMLILVHPSSGVDSLRQLLDEGRSKPGQLAYATPGTGTPHHFAMELLKSRSGANFVHVPYKGAAPALTDVVGGQVPILVATPASAADFVANGRLRLLATMDPARLAAYPATPAVAESIDKFDVSIWHGLMVPASTPVPVIDALSSALKKVLSDESIQKRLAAVGFTSHYEPSNAMKARISTELVVWKDVADKARMVAE